MADNISPARRTLFESPNKDPGATQSQPLPKEKNDPPAQENFPPLIDPKKTPTPETMVMGEKENKKDKMTTSGESLNKWSSPLDMENDVAEFVKRCQNSSHLVTDVGVLVDLPELRDIEQKMVSVFVVDKKSKRVVRSTKDVVLKLLTGFGAKIINIVKGSGFVAWDVLLPSKEECVKLMRRDLHTRDYFLRVEYLGTRKTKVAVFEVPWGVSGESIGKFLMKYGEIVGYSSDRLRGEWRYDMLLGDEAFSSIPNFLDIDHGRKLLPIYVTGRKPRCWVCGETGHLAATCVGKEAPKSPAMETQDTFPSTDTAEKGSPVDPPAVMTRKIRSTVGAHLCPPQKPAPPSPKTNRAASGESESEWSTVGKDGKKVQNAAPQSWPKLQPVDTDTRDTPQSYAKNLRTGGGFVSPSKDKFDKARIFLKEYNEKQQKITSSPDKQKTPKSSPSRTLRSPPVTRSQPIMTKNTYLPITEPCTPPPKSQPSAMLPHPKTSPPPPPPPTAMDPPPPPPPVQPSSQPSSVTKRQRSPSVGSSDEQPTKKEIKKKQKRNAHICRVGKNEMADIDKIGFPGTVTEKLETLYKFKSINKKEIENPENFPEAKKVLSMVKHGEKARQVWDVLKVANDAFSFPLAEWLTEEVKKLRAHCSGRVPVLLHPSLYRKVKLTFPKYIGGLSHDGSIDNEMGHKPIETAVGVLSPSMFAPVDQHH